MGRQVTPAAPHPTKDGRYHVRRRTLLFDRIGWTCARCGQGSLRPSSLHADHIAGDRNGVNTKQELSRLLSLPLSTVRTQVQTLCPPCHDAKSAENGDWNWSYC